MVDSSSPYLRKDEVQWAIFSLKVSKAPRVDMITAEEIVAAGEKREYILFALCSMIWQEKRIPEEWKKSIIVSIFKKERQSYI
jgi:hypothetical protein